MIKKHLEHLEKDELENNGLCPECGKIMRDAKTDLEVCQKATPGPWEVENAETKSRFSKGWRTVKAPTGYIIGVDGYLSSIGGEVYGVKITYSDAKFIALAREALPYWINRAMGLEKELKRMRTLESGDGLNKSDENDENDGEDSWEERRPCELEKDGRCTDFEVLCGITGENTCCQSCEKARNCEEPCEYAIIE